MLKLHLKRVKIAETPPSNHKQTIPSKNNIITQNHNKNRHQHTNTIANIKERTQNPHQDNQFENHTNRTSITTETK